MKKCFNITIGTILFFFLTTQAQVNSDVNTSRENIDGGKVSETTAAAAADQTEDRMEPAMQSGIVGFRLLPTFSKMNVQNSAGVSVKGNAVVSFGYGGVLGFNLNRHVGFQAEVLHNTLSQKYADNTLNRQIDINYVNVPLLLSLNTDRMSEVNLNFVFGPQWGFNISSSVKTTGTSNGTPDTQAVLAVKKNDFGIAYGAGLDFGLNAARTIRLDLGFRGVLGLIDISDHSKTLETNSFYIIQKSQTQTYSGYIGFTFLL